MITHIQMKNFKSWKDSGEVELAPLTGFFGTNSSGKSSLLQMLLLLKQTVKSGTVLSFGSENSLINLGNFREVIHRHKEDELLELEFGCKLQNSSTFEFLQDDKYGHSTKFSLDVDSFTFEVAFQGGGSTASVKHNCYTVGPDKNIKIKWENGYLWSENRRERGGSINGFYRLSGSSRDDLLRYLSSSFETLFDQVYPLGPTRAHPQRLYYWEGTHPESIGQNGENMIDSLLSARIDLRTTPYNETDLQIEDRISAWLREMDLAYSFSLDRTGPSENRNYEVRVQKSLDSPKVTLADMGYGLAQFLPVLVHCYYAPVGSTLILEQPGVHLHPKVQSQLADLLIEVVTERNLQILVESHSEHLLNRLQRRIAEEKISVEKTALYFCRNDESVSNIERLKMDEFGNISNWPENFFGNEMGDLFAMTEAQSERRKRAEGE